MYIYVQSQEGYRPQKVICWRKLMKCLLQKMRQVIQEQLSVHQIVREEEPGWVTGLYQTNAGVSVFKFSSDNRVSVFKFSSDNMLQNSYWENFYAQIDLYGKKCFNRMSMEV